MKLHLRNPLVVFDLETTGVNVCRDRIVEISMLKLLPSGEKELKTMRINPGRPIPLETSLIHGIYDSDVADKPTFAEVAKEVAAFIEGADFGGFNVIKFDLPLLVEELLRCGIELDLKKRKMVDAQKIFHMMEPRTLSAAYKFYCDKDLDNAHSAEADTLATFAVIEAQVERYEGKVIKDKDGKEYVPVKNDINALHKIGTNKMVDLAGRMVYNKEGVPVFNFGKHKNQPVADVLKREPGYYKWMLNNEFPLDTKQRLTEIRLKSGLLG